MLMFKNGVFLPLVYAKDDHVVWRIQERRDESDDEEELEDAWLIWRRWESSRRRARTHTHADCRPIIIESCCSC